MKIQVTEDHICQGSRIIWGDDRENPIELALHEKYKFSYFTILPCGFVIRDFLGVIMLRAPRLPKNAEEWLDNWIITDDGEPFEFEYDL